MTLQELEKNEVWIQSYGYKLDFKGFNYYWCVPEWDRLIPTENTLEFTDEYIKACMKTPPEMDCIGFYSNGWEL